MNKNVYRRLLSTSLLGGLALMAHGAVHAQEAPQDAQAPQAESGLGEIVVTARGREENFIDVPLAVTAVSAGALQNLDVKSTNSLTSYVPSVEFSNMASGNFGGRLAVRPLIIRGLNLSNNYGVTAAALIFLDGGPVLGGELAPGLEYERVEVLRGPQSVYFGRSTLSGAVNYVTKSMPHKPSGSVEMKIAEYGTMELTGNVSTPVTDYLRIGISGGHIANEGYYKNGVAGSQALGAQETNSIAGRFEFEPTDTFSVKGYVNYFEHDDGAAAQAQLPATADNCSLGGTRQYYCGTFPGVRTLGLYTNTMIPTDQLNFVSKSFVNQDGRFRPVAGVQRDALLGHVIATWNVADAVEIRSLSAYEWDVSSGINNGKLRPEAATDAYDYYYYSASFRSKNFSQEVRFSSTYDSPLQWTLGGSYVDGSSRQQFLVASKLQSAATGTNFNTGVQSDETKSIGVFGGAYYELAAPLKLSLEARYQWDKRKGVPAAGATLEKTFKSFSPRVSLDYKINPDTTVYASFSRGTRPGGFNLRLPPYFASTNAVAGVSNADVIADLQRQLGPVSLSYEEERLTNYEIGIKGNALGGKARFALDAYYGELSNQQITNSAYIGLIANTLQATSNIGRSEIWGVEFDGSVRATDMITFTGTFAWNKTKIKEFLCTACVIYTGSTDISGNPLGLAPELTGSFAVDLENDLGSTGWRWFGHADYVYRGKVHIDNFSDQTIKARNIINLRAGVSQEHLTLEAFVTNVTNNKNYESSTVQQDYAANRFSAFAFNVPQPRTVGGRARFKF